jgi:hypothetical protein
LRLTLVGCEEVHIWKKIWFRLKAAAKQIWRRPYPSKISRSMKRKASNEERKERKERGENAAASRKQVRDENTAYGSRADARILLVSLVTS